MRTYAFIDASNIIYGTRDEGWKVDFRKLYKYLKERYDCNEKQAKFYGKLESFGFELVLKPVKIFKQPGGKQVRKANIETKKQVLVFANSKRTAREIKILERGNKK